MVVTKAVAAILPAVVAMFRIAAITPVSVTALKKTPGGRKQGGDAKQN